MSLQAYHQAAKRAESPRQAEYRLFAQVTLALMEAAKADPSDVAARIDALDWNRRVWTVLGDDCANPANGLPAPLRASIISLAIWVGRHTSAVIRRREDIEPLIEVNRLIMQGLAPGAVSAQTAAA
ncbi:MAG: flagellar FlaF family protein [Phenylobacterium sp.]|jgi:flagellar protein FlaF|uniref:flagellar biosynthesis regulator FlaF n=1 Tax=Phenylobacterium sp. TaxID=1871053 RepID=UPI00262B4621|nr:flagellar biosynthesis regulator FlaF [Phenylobacterium sp.]MDB5427403.1 flagellar FlaF family protein [Phenylobacterium sp.]MDB5462164.1 flagellar FlaF family protein [Phenylobacterium sp.]MDB5496491.1 flagellar FlaF family protein [Phenylobacterium sp.]